MDRKKAQESGVFIKNIMQNLLYVCKQIGLRCTLNVGFDRKSKAAIGNLLKELGSSIYEVDIVFYPFCYVGGAKEYLDARDMAKTYVPQQLRCKMNGILAIMPNGDTYPCCSPCRIDSLKLGNIKLNTLDQLLQSYKTNMPFLTVLSRGLSHIAEDIVKNDLFALEPLYIDSCDFCSFIFGDSIRRNCLLDFYKTKFLQ
ncbi:MAG: hypothetical protein HFH91_17660 [Lachnospiraceae bacterium]|nr:hypothetical protein [Lachnospiraceae bacterium]